MCCIVRPSDFPQTDSKGIVVNSATLSNLVKDVPIKASSSRAVESLLNALVEEEVSRRATLLRKGMDLLTAAEEAVAKIKPDGKTYSGDNLAEPSSVFYTPKTRDELLKAQANLKKISDALDKALATDSPDYGPLDKIVSKKSDSSSE